MGILYLTKIINTMATPEEQAIQGVIDQIWETYDVDKSGALDKEETKKFVQDTLETSDPVMNSPTKLLMKSSAPSTRTTPVPLRRTRWSFSSSNSSEDNEQDEERHRFKILD